MKRNIILILLAMLSMMPLYGQFEGEFDRLYQKGIDTTYYTKPDYAAAIAYFLAAGRADPSKSWKADSMVLEVMELIQRQSNRERQSRIAAQQARTQSDSLARYFFSETSNAQAAWAYRDGKFAVIDRNGKQLSDFVWEEPEPFVDSLCIARQSGAYFFVNQKGKKKSEAFEWYHPTTLGLNYSIQAKGKAIPLTNFGQKWTSPHTLDPLKIIPIDPSIEVSDEWISFQQDGKAGLFQKKNRQVISPSFEEAWFFFNGRAQIRYKEKYGFIDESGEIVIKPIYEYVGDFSEQRARVIKEGKWLFIDTQGNKIHDSDYKSIRDFSEGKAKVKEAQKWGFINRLGRDVVRAAYDDTGDFSQGMAKIKKGDKWGFINHSGYEVIPCLYDHVLDFSHGRSWVRSDGKWGLIDKNNNLILDTIYEEFYPFSERFSEGKSWVKYQGKWGLVDTTGKNILDHIYDSHGGNFKDGKASILQGGKYDLIDSSGKIATSLEDVRDFYQGFAPVKKAGKWGVINEKGKFIIRPKYEGVGNFINGIARVKVGDKWGFISTLDQEIIAPIYSYVSDLTRGIALVQKEDKYFFIDSRGYEVIQANPEYGNFLAFFNNRAKIKKDGKWGFINPSGKVIILIQYDSAGDFREGKAWVERNGEFGFIDPQGEVCLPFNFKEVGSFKKGLAKVRIGDKYGFIDSLGNLSISAKYRDAGDFQNGLARAAAVDKYGYIDIYGEYKISPKYDVARDFSHGKAWVKINGKPWKFINTSGTEIDSLSLRYNEVKDFNQSRAWFRFASTGIPGPYDRVKWGVINDIGKEVIPATYKDVNDFSNLGSIVKKDSNWGVINTLGKEVIPFNFEEILNYFGKVFRVKKEGKYGLLNNERNFLLDIEYDQIRPIGLNILITEQAGKYGLVILKEKTFQKESKKSNFISISKYLPPIYEEIGYPYNGILTPVKKNNKWGFVAWEKQPNGEEHGILKIPCRYDAVAPFEEINGKLYARVYVAEYNLDFYINTKGEMVADIGYE